MSNNKTWTNWAGTAECHPRTFLYPTSEEEIQSIVKEAIKDGHKVRVAGNGHSFTKLVETDSILLSLDKWQGIIEVDGNIVEVRSGTNIKKLGEELFNIGLGQENLGDIDIQSIAGAVSTGTHGTGIHLGNLATQVVEITFVNGKGELITCSEEIERDIFKSAQISIGALGIITRMKIKCTPKYKLELINSKSTFNECLENLESYKTENRNFEFYYFPYSDIVQYKITNITDNEPKEGGIMKYLNDIILENGIFKIMSEISRLIPATSKKISWMVGRFSSEAVRSTWSHQVFATTRLVRFTEMEYNIPAEHFTDCLKELRAKIEKEEYHLHFPLECRFVKGDDIWLSPAYQRDSAYIAVHMYKGMKFRKYFSDMETIFKKYQGRPHWGKLHYLTPMDLEEKYPMWEKFHAVRLQMDPKGIFMNDYLHSIFGK